jgi:hypothetical protein
MVAAVLVAAVAAPATSVVLIVAACSAGVCD